MVKDRKSGISIQVSLSGYSFKLYQNGEVIMSSPWLPAGDVFVTPEFQRRYDAVELSVFTPKCTLVPSQFFCPEKAREILADVCVLEQDDAVSSVAIPEFGAVLVFSTLTGENISRTLSATVLQTDGTGVKALPEFYFMLDSFSGIPEYNKIEAAYRDGYLYLLIGQGKSLLLCNSFEATDFTTALYFIFLAMKKLQLNPEVSSIYFRTPLSPDQEDTLYRYFKSVDYL